MSEVTIFSSKEFGKIRQVLMDGEPYFVAKDVAIMLGYKDPTNTIKQHCKGGGSETIPPSN